MLASSVLKLIPFTGSAYGDSPVIRDMEVNYFVFGCCSGDDEADHDVFYRDKACKLVQCWSR